MAMPPLPRRALPRLHALALLLAVMSLACADGAGGRETVILDTLLDDNRDLLERDAALVAEKLAKMSTSAYAFFRGSGRLFGADLAQPGAWPTRFGGFEAAQILIAGDPHIENFGTFRAADGTAAFDMNDFDAARYGPYWWDVRRLALSIFVAWDAIGLGLDDAEAAASGLVAAYVEEIEAIAAGAEGVRVRPAAGFGAVVDDLFRRALRDGDAGEALTEYTRLAETPEGAVRSMFFGTIEASADARFAEDEVVAVSEEEERRVRRLVAGYARSADASAVYEPDAFEVLGVSRRLGAGVSSYPLLRYYALLAGPSASPDDDWLVELKETRDPLVIEGFASAAPRAFADNAARVVAAQRLLQERADLDALLGAAHDGGTAFRIRERTKYQRGTEVARLADDLAEGDIDTDDLAQLAEVLGRVLARAHGRAETATGRRGADVISAAIAGAGDPFVAETVAFAAEYSGVVASDWLAFRGLLEREGPTLGYVPEVPR